MTSSLEQLRARNCVHDVSHPELLEKTLNNEKLTFYCGFDPTSDSLHIGSMLPLIIMRRLQEQGHRPLVLLGSATGMIGDPSGKSQERVLLDQEQVLANVESISEQVKMFLDFEGDNAALIVSNNDWLSKIGFIEFLRDIGKHFSVGAMCAKDSVKSRLENREQGISFTEFSYSLLQAYDFYWLHKEHNCRLQVGGSDQWGNITAGLELIRRKSPEENKQAFGLTFPLLTTSAGTKFGKTEKGAVWLDKDKTSPYHFYQYWLNASDEDALIYMEYFSAKKRETLDDLAENHKSQPGKRLAQNALAEELCTLVHGKAETASAKNASEILFKKSFKDASATILLDIFQDIPSHDLARSDLESGVQLPELLILLGASKSKGQARKLIDGGGIYLNNERQDDSTFKVTLGDFVEESVLVVRSGKKNYFLLKVSN